MKKKCNWCDETTVRSREDFYEIGWGAFKFGRDKTIYACPKHRLEMREEMINIVRGTHKQ